MGVPCCFGTEPERGIDLSHENRLDAGRPECWGAHAHGCGSGARWRVLTGNSCVVWKKAIDAGSHEDLGCSFLCCVALGKFYLPGPWFHLILKMGILLFMGFALYLLEGQRKAGFRMINSKGWPTFLSATDPDSMSGLPVRALDSSWANDSEKSVPLPHFSLPLFSWPLALPSSFGKP